MQENIKKNAVSGVVWMYGERIVAQVVSLVVATIIARILDPEHYGIIAIANVFITICNAFVVTGLGESLVQKKDSDELDFSSIFYVNISLAIILYAIVFVSAPLISSFYDGKYPELVSVSRVMGLRLIIAAINSVQRAKVSKEMSFQKFFWVTLFGTIVSAVVGIVMAYRGFGVWALVAQYMTNSTIDTVMLFLFIRWIPKLQFSMQRVKPLVKYGWKILASSLLSTVYNELRSLLIGKRYMSQDLAFYEKGNTYPKIIVNNLNSAISSVLFPVMSKIQDDTEAVRSVLRKALKATSFLVFPAIAGLALVAEPLVRLLLTEKWLPAVPYLQMMCVVYAILPLSQANLQCITSQGHSAKYLWITFVKRGLGIALLAAVFRISVKWIAISQLTSSVIDYFIDMMACGKYIRYSVWTQLKDLLPNFVLTLVMGSSVWLIGCLLSNVGDLVCVVCQAAVGVAVYALGASIFKIETYCYFKHWIKRQLQKKQTNFD